MASRIVLKSMLSLEQFCDHIALTFDHCVYSLLNTDFISDNLSCLKTFKDFIFNKSILYYIHMPDVFSLSAINRQNYNVVYIFHA